MRCIAVFPIGVRKNPHKRLKMNRVKIHKTVENLKMKGFYHDVQDLEEGIEEMLTDYDIQVEFSEEETKELDRDLREMAEINQIREVASTPFEDIGNLEAV
jgi:signal recognition particle GTPase